MYPYKKSGIYYSYKGKNPYSIYKNSSPYLYMTRTSGVQLRGSFDPLIPPPHKAYIFPSLHLTNFASLVVTVSFTSLPSGQRSFSTAKSSTL